MFKRPAGVILLTLNHNGDRMAARKALRLAEKAGIENVKEIIAQEDIAPGIDADPEDRRGLGGCIPLMKVMGAACEAGKSIDEVLAIGEAFHAQLATLSVALKVATHPQNGAEIGALADDEMEIGMGQHGEGGGGVMKIQSADETAKIMVERLVSATKLESGDRALLIINGSGATTAMEMLICYRAAAKVLMGMGISLVNGLATELLTVQEMAGFQMTLAKVTPETEALLAAKANAPYWVCNG
jgi:dihydroxyacetone kinase-like protein